MKNDFSPLFLKKNAPLLTFYSVIRYYRPFFLKYLSFLLFLFVLPPFLLKQGLFPTPLQDLLFWITISLFLWLLFVLVYSIYKTIHQIKRTKILTKEIMQKHNILHKR